MMTHPDGSEPKPVKAWAVWHPKLHFRLGLYYPSKREAISYMKDDGFWPLPSGWRIIPVEIIPANDESR